METISLNSSTDSQHLVLIVHHLDADLSMESRLSWYRAVQASCLADTTVVCAKVSQAVQDELEFVAPRLRVLQIPHTRLENWLGKFSSLFHLAYRLWHRRVYRHLTRLHGERPITLVHQVSYCGYREPGESWKLKVPFVWGPLGGTQSLPWNFVTQLGPAGAAIETARNLINACQLKFCPRVRRAMHSASVVLSANTEVKQVLDREFGIECKCQLETGLETVAHPGRPLRRAEEPLRILWAGRLERWKGFPLLVRALACVSANVDFELRVLGGGSQEKRYRRLVEKHGFSDRVEWAGWPPVSSRREHYRWSDVFAFTSLRDTSGTGLLESLAEGNVLIALDHQGARDVTTPECGIAIAVETPSQVVDDFAAAIEQLASDPVRLQEMSRAATERAKDFEWERLAQQMARCYQLALGEQRVEAVESCAAKTPVVAR